MNCENIKPLVSEYVDGTLAPERQRLVRAHLEQCAACARLAEDFRALGRLLHGLPAAQMTAGFESDLAARLAHARRPSPLTSWLRRIAGTLRPVPARRPALALGAALLVTAGVVMHPQPLGPITPGPITPATVSFDQPLVTHCVEQHRSDAAAQPLSDIAAQNLATQLDATGSLTDEEENL